MEPMKSILTVPLFCSESPTLLCNLYCSAFFACLFAWFIPIIFWLKWQMGHKHNECFAFSSFILATLYFGIVLKLALAKKINGLRLSVVCEAFVNVAGAQLRIRKHG